MRNYAVLHIVAEESRIFKTKERCPLLLCIEVYRPTEISLEAIPDVLNKSKIKQENLSRNQNDAIEEKSNVSFDSVQRKANLKKRAQTMYQNQ